MSKNGMGENSYYHLGSNEVIASKAFTKGYLAGLKYGIETLEKRLKVLIPQESGIVKECIEELKEELNNRK